jgi:hypothetical protein
MPEIALGQLSHMLSHLSELCKFAMLIAAECAVPLSTPQGLGQWDSRLRHRDTVLAETSYALRE